MSPIIKEPDGTEHIPLDTDNGNTPFPEDISIQPASIGATGNASKVNVKIPAEGLESSKLKSIADKKRRSSLVQKINTTAKNEAVLKRSQSLRTRISPYDHQNGSKLSLTQTKQPQSDDSDFINPISKSKSGKFKMFKNRWSMFPKYSAPESETKELYNLRRSQSMKIPCKSNQTVSSLVSISESPSKVSEKKLEKRSIPKYDIKNSKSLIDIRHLSKKEITADKNNEIKRSSNTLNRTESNHVQNNRSLSKKLSKDIDPVKEQTTKNFAHKTIDVIRKSVQGKLKVNFEKQNKKKQEIIKTNCKTSLNNEIPLRKFSKDLVKNNSKRKKNDINDYDSEFKPKKKVSSVEKDKIKPVVITHLSKSNGADLIPSSKNNIEKNIKRSFNNTNKSTADKTLLKINNKRNLTDRENTTNGNNTKQLDVPVNLTNNMNTYQYENNNVIYSGKLPSVSASPYTIQSHHVLFLNNIHETLSNSHRLRTEIVPTPKSLYFIEKEPLPKHEASKVFPKNLNKNNSGKLSKSLPLLANKKVPNRDPIICTSPATLIRSLSVTCNNNDKSLSIFKQEINSKSTSPMSISNYDEEISKVDNMQSAVSFTCSYDPYIDETIDEYLCEGDGETHYGSLFSKSKSTWNDFSGNFKLELDFNSGSYYFDGLNDNVDNNFGLYNANKLNNFASKTTSLNVEDPNVGKDQSPASLPLDFEIKIYDSRRSNELKLCSLQNTELFLNSQNSVASVTDVKCQNVLVKKQNNSITNGRIPSKKFTTASGKAKDNEESTVTKSEVKPTKNKIPELKIQLNESKMKRKVVKSNLRASPIISLNRPKKLKEISKLEDVNLSPEMRNKINKKSLSENVINNKIEKETHLKKEKSELGVLESKEKRQYNVKTETNKTVSLTHLPNNDERNNVIKWDPRNEGSVASGTHGVRAPGRDRINRPLPDRAISRLSSAPDATDEKKCQDLPAGATRRSKIDNSKAALTKAFRGPSGRTKQTDPVKILRPSAPNGQPPSQIPSHISDQLKKLEAELSARTQEAQSAREEVSRANRGLEALTVLVHYLTNEYNAFATPKLKAEVERLSSQLTDVRLCLDESTAAASRLEIEATERCQKHEEVVRNLEETHCEEISSITLEHQKKLDEVVENHNEELKKIVNREECKYESLIQSHNEELERIEKGWRTELDKQHERHLQALEQLNSCHSQQLRDTEESWKLREQTLQETNERLLKDQATLKQQAKKLEETLLSDKDHRLQAAKRVCTALQNEVDSLKTVVDMRNGEVHKLRDQLADKERITEELDCAKDRVRALQAKTEDLHAQMETKLQLERQLLSDRHALSDSLQREASINKRLSLENEELQWKLRQRDANPNVTHSTSTLDLVTRCSSGLTRQQEGCKTGVLSPQFTPRSQRIGTKPHDKKWSQSFSNIPEDAGKLLRRAELQHDDVTIESPPPSPRVKAVIEKSNSVSFILDLNDTFPDQPFIGAQSYHHGVKPRTPNLQRKSLTKSYSHSLEKSRSASLVHGNSKSISMHHDSRDFNGKSPKERVNGIKREKLNGDCNSIDCENEINKRSSKYRTHSTSESSDSGDIERISPTGLSWTVPVHSNMKRYSKHIPNNRFQLVPEPPRLLQQPDEDEYEENENEFVEVLTLGEDLNSAPLTMLFGQTPSTSVSLSDSDVSQCGSRADLSSEDDDDDGTLLQKESQSRPLEGAGEAMIFPDVFDLKRNDENCKSIPKSQISSAPSSDSEDANQATHAEEPLNMSWSEDAECDLTSSSEMQELL